MPRNSAATANSHAVDAVLAGAASSSAVPTTRASMAAAAAVLRAPAVQPPAHGGSAAKPRGHARRHGQAGGQGRQPQHVDAVQKQERAQQAGAHREGDGVARAAGGAEESVRAGGHAATVRPGAEPGPAG